MNCFQIYEMFIKCLSNYQIRSHVIIKYDKYDSSVSSVRLWVNHIDDSRCGERGLTAWRNDSFECNANRCISVNSKNPSDHIT